MKPKSLHISLAVISASLITLPASAAWLDNNLRDGLQFAISGTVSPSIVSNSSRFTYVYGDPTVYGLNGTITQVLADQDKRETDERARLSGLNTGSVWFTAYKQIHRDMTIGGNVGLYGTPWISDSGYNRYWQKNIAFQYGLTLTHDKYGSIGINSNPSTNRSVVTTSGVNGVLDTPQNAISAEYTYIPDLKIVAYHAFPASENTSIVDAAIHKGQGISVEYTRAFAPRHKLTGAVGYTKTERHVDLNSNDTAKYKEAQGVGLSYQYDNVTVDVNYGEANESFDGSRISDTDISAYGVKLNYEVTPRINTYITYGKYESDKHGTTNSDLTYANLLTEGRGVSESNLFDKVERASYGLGVDYNLYRNVTLRGTVGRTETENYVVEGLFSKREATNYTLGASFSF